MRNDENKRRMEMTCLQSALHTSMTSKNTKLLCGILGPRDEWAQGWMTYDRPDLYRIANDEIIGIEHFMVDGLSEMGGGHKVQSSSSIAKSYMEKKRCDYVNNGIENNDNVGNIVQDIMRMASAHLLSGAYVLGKYLIEALGQALFGEDGKSGHVYKVNNAYGDHEKSYRDRLHDIAPDKKVKVGLLVEIVGDFSELVVFDGETYGRNEMRIMPLSHDVVHMLSDALRQNVDFIILYRKAVSFDGKVRNDRTFVMTEPTDDAKGYMNGEIVYNRLCGAQAKRPDVKVEMRVRHRQKDGAWDIFQNVSDRSKTDMPEYMKLVALGMCSVKRRQGYYADSYLAAIVYAFSHIDHKWGYTQYIGPSGVTLGIVPYGFDIRVFERLRYEFIKRFSPSTLGNNTLDFDTDDNSKGDWDVKKFNKLRFYGL